MQHLLLEKGINLFLTGDKWAEVEQQKREKIVEMRFNDLGMEQNSVEDVWLQIKNFPLKV
ncbi:hypothetical protein [Nostoc sp.]|uniref:hypothetical protein n=1 Tax=Nostoc sp. TaxID=1180 RepID=UPI002FFA5ED3